MSNLIDLEISITSVHILQRSGIWDLEDIITMMDSHPATTSLALARIKSEDFEEITKAIKKTYTKNLTSYAEPDSSIV